MSMIMIKVPKDRTMELKQMISEGLHIFGRAMSLAEEMCAGEAIGERLGSGGYGERTGMRDGGYGMRGYHDGGEVIGQREAESYPYPMNERDLSIRSPWMSENRMYERRMRDSGGRFL